ncbi:hypothetical protein XA68_17025 [Ophiocordyceps unilateralis]|uniref:Triosephosphate isomerase n=1 Tax=Ophiocordyceps unilateralis TaxID=268505 RepID=A0A2A9P4M2_OPHUN|nr:hypothetical protein XA68_17025 [Ophiocordyceps unilateralis]
MSATTWPRRRMVGLSTKMYFSLSRTRDFVNRLLELLSDERAEQLSEMDMFVIPDFVSLAETSARLGAARPKPVWTGAQDCGWEDQGAFTGEVSAGVLREAGVKIVIVGHAERRSIMGEDDAMVASKAAAVCRNRMVPLVCIGERTVEAGIDGAVAECRLQVEAVVAVLPADADLVLAYEPVWAIGADRPAGDEHIMAVVDGIRQLDCLCRRRQGSVRVLYGGSAGPGLFARLSGSLDGLFVGRFGHDPEQFVRTIREVASA